MMRKVLKRFIVALVAIICALGYAPLFSQTTNTFDVWPGDVNNNGRVNAVDLLYIGHEYGKTGPTRTIPSTIFLEQEGFEWNETFEDSLYPIDIGYADVDGNGAIDDDDIDGVRANFGLERNQVFTDGYQTGVEGVDPELILETSSYSINEGTVLDVTIKLGETINVSDFHGIAFQLSYNPELIEDNTTIDFSLDNNSWIASSNSNELKIVDEIESSPSQNRTQLGITKTNGFGLSGGGTIGIFSFIIEDIVITPKDTLIIEVDSVRMVDSEFKTVPVSLQNARIEVEVNQGDRNSATDCPKVYEFVVASNGVTYMNSCYAEADGQTLYTVGTGFGECIDPASIQAEPECESTESNQVCGCNGQTFQNPCYAEAAGVLSYTSGPCTANCYDPNLAQSSGYIDIDSDTGILTHKCGDFTYDPVCACNGVTYNNPCLAEASGIQSYTPGTCENACVNPALINSDPQCPENYDPVCGCNDVTYSNSCYAEAAGIQSHTPGACGTGGGTEVGWCSTVETIYCGDFLLDETTIGQPNNIVEYSILPNYTLLGPDKIYKINKTTPGDLQIVLEITTPNLDLDLFLLSGDCNDYDVVDGSYTSNATSNLETITYNNAPIGTYYIVVDGEFPSSQGNYRLEVSCGYLDCSNTQNLDCGHTFNYNNAYGSDDISLYSCNNISCAENNGPEVVHTFTTTATGQVDIYLSNLSANLELYLLNACDRESCMENSTNPGTNNEHISAYLPPGTYYVVVDGYNGATSNYNLLVDCVSSCNLNVTVTTTNSSCGQNSGSINVSSTGGTPGYVVTYDGPVSGSFYTYSSNCTIYNLPPGVYTVTKTDVNGCSDSEIVTVNDGSNLMINTWTTDPICGMGGAIEVTVSNGVGPYTVSVTGPKNVSLTSISNTFNITDLVPGTYTIQVTDAYGCVSLETVTLGDNNTGFTYTATPFPASCGSLGYIHVWIPDNNDAPYNILLNGPVSGFNSTNSNDFNIINLPGGTYTLTIENEYWCQETQTVVVPNTYMTIGTIVNNGICGEDGSITVNISSGSPSYHIQWSGAENGSFTTNNPSYTINDLMSGTYTVSVTDDNGCTDYEVLNVDNSNSYLNTNVVPITGSCGLGSIWIDINNGHAPYKITWDGPISSMANTSNDGYDIQDIPMGTYTITIIDDNGCSSTHTVTVNSNGGPIDIQLNTYPGNCGANGSIWVGIANGTVPYTISWDGPSSGATVSNNSSYSINDLSNGTYNITVTDDYGCVATKSITLINGVGNLTATATPTQITCGQYGSIWVDITSGVPNYQIEWDGPVSNSIIISDNWYNIQNLPAGTYTITITDFSGCSIVKTIEVITVGSDLSISTSVTHEACTSAGSIWVNINGGTAPYIIDWSGAANGTQNTSGQGYNITNLWQGTYTVVVTDANGCQDSQTVTINIAPSITINATGIDCVCGDNGSIWLSFSGGTAPYTVQWDGPASGNVTTVDQNYDILDLSCGSYSITVTDDNGCTATTSITLGQNGGNLNASLWTTDANCEGYGAIEVTIMGGDADYKIDWSGASTGTATTSSTNYNILNLVAGAYTITVTDDNGCTTTTSTTLGQNGGNLNASLWTTDANCGGYGAIEVTITGGDTDYTIDWSGASTGTATTSNINYNILNLVAGAYSITVTDNNGCTTTAQTTINSTGALSVTENTTNADCCDLGEIDLTVTGGSGNYTYTWNPAVSTSNRAQDLDAGIYEVTISDGTSCSTTASYTIYNTCVCEDIFTVDTIYHAGTNDLDYCVPIPYLDRTIYDIILDSQPYNLPTDPCDLDTIIYYSYAVVFGQGNSGPYEITSWNAHGQQFSGIVNDMDALTDSLNAWDPAGNWIHQPSIFTISGGDNSSNYANIEIKHLGSGVTATIQTNYTSVAFGFEVTIDGTPGTHELVVTDTTTCCSDTLIIVISDNCDLATNLSKTDAICDLDGSIQVSWTGGATPYDIEWSGQETGSATAASSPYTISGLDPGNYTVKVTDYNGCSETKSIYVGQSVGNLALSTTVTNGVCGANGSIGTNISGGTAPYEITWNGTVNGTFTTNNSTYDITNLPSGTYVVKVTDANWCMDTETVVISNGNNSLSTSTEVVNGTCGTLGSIWVTINSGIADYLISWSGPSNGSTTTSNSNYAISNLSSGSYTITVSDSNGCTSAETVTVNNSNGSFSIIAASNNGICGSNGSIDVSMSGGTADYTITWNGPVNGSVTQSSTDYTISSLPIGSYNVTVVDANGCGQSTTVSIGNSSGLSVSTTPYTAYCGQGGSIWIDITGGTADYTITWSGPSSGSATTSDMSYEIIDLTNGTYTVNVTGSNGCSDTEVVTIGNSNNNFSFSTVVTNTSCNSLGSIELNITGGAGDFTVSWSGASTGTTTISTNTYTITDLGAGTYTIMLTDNNGCSTSQTVSIYNTVGNLSLSASPTNAYCGVSGSIWLNISGGTADYTISWTGASTGTATSTSSSYDITNLLAGSYTINVTDGNGCTASTTTTVGSTGGNLSLNASPTDAYCGVNGSIWLTISGGTADYTISWSGASTGSATSTSSSYDITNLPAGSYTINVTDGNGCTVSTTTTIGTTGGNLSLNASPTDAYCGVNGSIWLTINGGTADYTISWSGASTGSATSTSSSYDITNLSAGSYTINVTDGNGCTASTTAIVGSNGGNLSVDATATDMYCGIQGSIWLIISGGNPTYTITWTGPSSGTGTSNTTAFDIPNLDAGTYIVTITDQNGCSITETLVVNNNSGSLSLTATPTNAACGVPGSIWLNISGGTAPYFIEWTGDATGNATSSSSNFDIPNLSAGTYTVEVTDANACTTTETVTVSNSGSNLSVVANPTNVVCGTAGSIWVTITGGSADYTITWTGPSSGSATTNNSAFDITNLGMGDYTITVTDATGCSTVQTATVGGSIALAATITPNNGSCGNGDGSISIMINNGSPNYTVFWTGPVSDNAVISTNDISIDNLPTGTYTVSIEDANGCNHVETVSIYNTNGAPVAGFSSIANVLTLSTTNTSSSGNYTWDFGDGTTSSASNPTYAFCDEGTYNVCLTVTNTCGSDTHCEMVTVTIPSGTARLQVSDVGASPGNMISIPVTIEDCDLIASLAGSIEVADPSVATITGLTPAKIAPQFFSANNTFNYYDNNGQGIPVADGDVLFYIDVTVTGTGGEITTISLTNNPLMIELGTIVNGATTILPHVALKGTLTVSSSLVVTGNIMTYWDEGVEDAEVMFTSPSYSAMEMTDANGEYMNPDVPSHEEYVIQPFKDINDENGLSTYALFVGQQFILGMNPEEISSPYQIIAGDANCSNSFTTLDLFIIQQLIIGTNDALNDCPSWVFVAEGSAMPSNYDAYNVFPYSNCDTMMLTQDTIANFVGVKVGDILGHANPNNFSNNEADQRNLDELYLVANKKTYEAGELVELRFRSSNFEDIASYQMGLAFDQTKLEFIDYTAPTHSNLAATAIGTAEANKGKLRASWFSTIGSGITLNDTEELFVLQFSATTAIDDISTLLSISSEDIHAEAHTSTLEQLDIVLEFVDETSTSTLDLDKATYVLHQNTPNPFKDITTIQFELPMPMEAELVIHNQVGAEIYRLEGKYTQGLHTITLDKDILTKGVYYYTLKTKDFTTTRSMISIE